jgi:hypothetical protein
MFKKKTAFRKAVFLCRFLLVKGSAIDKSSSIPSNSHEENCLSHILVEATIKGKSATNFLWQLNQNYSV